MHFKTVANVKCCIKITSNYLKQSFCIGIMTVAVLVAVERTLRSSKNSLLTVDDSALERIIFLNAMSCKIFRFTSTTVVH
jgi:hypothetical protein